MDSKKFKVGGFYPLKPEAYFKDVFTYPVFLTGRSALSYILQVKDVSKIYLPEFICRDVLDLMRNMNVKMSFYRAGFNYVDIDQVKKIESIMTQNDAFLFVNYFGFDSPLKSFQWQRDDIVLIEDSVGAFFSKSNIIHRNHFNIIGIRKYFPIGFGAIIYGDLKFKNFNKINLLYDYFVPSFIKRINGNEELYLSMWKEIEDFYSKIGKNSYIIDNFMRFFLNSINIDLEKIGRVKNYNYLFKYLNGEELDDKTVPLYFLIDFDEDMYRYLKSNGIFPAILWKNTRIKYLGLSVSAYYKEKDMYNIVSVLRNIRYEGLR